MKTKKNNKEVTKADNPTTVKAEVVESQSENNNEQSGGETINLESSKSTLSKRPWRLGAVKIPFEKDGTKRDAWVAAVIDQNGRAVCCGDTVDMEFIIKMENSYDAILQAINMSGKALADAVDVLEDFECKKTKSFKFN